MGELEIKNPTVMAQLKMVSMALNNLSEDNARQLAQHIKSLGRRIEQHEIEHKLDGHPTETNG